MLFCESRPAALKAGVKETVKAPVAEVEKEIGMEVLLGTVEVVVEDGLVMLK